MVGKHRAFGLCLRHDLIPWASSEIEWLPAPWTVDALRKKPDTCSRNLQDNLPRQLDLDWRSGYIPLEHDALYKGSLAVVKMPWSQCHLKKSKYPILIRQPWKHGQVQQWGPVGGPYCVPGKESASLVLLGFLGQLLFSESQLLAVLEKVTMLFYYGCVGDDQCMKEMSDWEGLSSPRSTDVQQVLSTGEGPIKTGCCCRKQDSHRQCGRS
uniref:Uncharacterized protein n=1 Tax=Toxoplasma gondii (strain ATCC 50861 / VEG) TaxID=432359 RepID=A0A0F7UTS2_TOXGV|nr:TPA: hypothetical protein BN1205_014270 [Toxoplasma gondii VEG]